jgi:hypothetical protein
MFLYTLVCLKCHILDEGEFRLIGYGLRPIPPIGAAIINNTLSLKGRTCQCKVVFNRLRRPSGSSPVCLIAHPPEDFLVIRENLLISYSPLVIGFYLLWSWCYYFR